jgi:hypothetical protein
MVQRCRGLTCSSRQKVSEGLKIGAVKHTNVQVVLILRISSPYGERNSLSTSAKNGESEDEHKNLCAAIHGRGGNVVVLDECCGVPAANVALNEETDDEEGEARGVDADEQPAHVL